ISPASTTRLSLTSVSAATRDFLSCFRIASSTASEIWSATLSGWPSETDSEVNEKLLLMMSNPFRYIAKILLVSAAQFSARELVILRPARFDLDRAQQGGQAACGLPVETVQQAVN